MVVPLEIGGAVTARRYRGGMTILVTGATGNIGRRVVDQLLDLGITDIVALTANPEKAALPDEVRVVTGYLGRPHTLSAALDGVDRVYLAPLPATLDVTLDMIVGAGVSYLVALSGSAHWQEHADTVARAEVASTQLGPGEFCENFSMWGPQIAATGTVREPYPDLVEAPVSMDDIARVAAHLLADPTDAHVGRMYDLTGPESLTRVQIAEQVGIGLGRPVRFETCSRADAEAALRPTMGAAATFYLDTIASFVDQPQAANALVADLTGTPAMSMAQWAAANADQFC